MAWVKFACPLVTPFCILITFVLPFLKINQQKVEIAARLNQLSEHHSESGLGQTLCLHFYISESRRKRLLCLVRANHVCFCTIFLLCWKSSTFSLSRKKIVSCGGLFIFCWWHSVLAACLTIVVRCCVVNRYAHVGKCSAARLASVMKEGTEVKGCSFSAHGVLCIEPQSSPTLF